MNADIGTAGFVVFTGVAFTADGCFTFEIAIHRGAPWPSQFPEIFSSTTAEAITIDIAVIAVKRTFLTCSYMSEVESGLAGGTGRDGSAESAVWDVFFAADAGIILIEGVARAQSEA